jgi:DNA-binding SARP family transcriptional activator
MQLITAYYLSERQSDALDAYQRLKSTLADDLGSDPGPSVRTLHERIRFWLRRPGSADSRTTRSCSTTPATATASASATASSPSRLASPRLRDRCGSADDFADGSCVGTPTRH